jgi:hypothetical protein
MESRERQGELEGPGERERARVLTYIAVMKAVLFRFKIHWMH